MYRIADDDLAERFVTWCKEHNIAVISSDQFNPAPNYTILAVVYPTLEIHTLTKLTWSDELPLDEFE